MFIFDLEDKFEIICKLIEEDKDKRLLFKEEGIFNTRKTVLLIDR